MRVKSMFWILIYHSLSRLLFNIFKNCCKHFVCIFLNVQFSHPVEHQFRCGSKNVFILSNFHPWSCLFLYSLKTCFQQTICISKMFKIFFLSDEHQFKCGSKSVSWILNYHPLSRLFNLPDNMEIQQKLPLFNFNLA